MLVVSVTLIPAGLEHLRREIGTLRISNASNRERVCDYLVTVMEAANPLTETMARIGICRVGNHDRIQPVWALVERAAAAAQTADFLEP